MSTTQAKPEKEKESSGNTVLNIAKDISSIWTSSQSSQRQGKPDVEISPIQLGTSKNLTDKLYEKRKVAAQEVEQLIRELNHEKDEERIRNVIQHLVTNFSDSSNGNARKGGLIALAATAIGLGSDTPTYIPQLVPPVLKCFIDQDSRVRYYACESLYNIAKVARGRILLYFNEIFDALCKLAADPDISVRNGAQLLDRLIKDILTEHQTLDIERFIPLLSERIYVINPYCRQFLIAWLVVLNSVPDVELLQYLPRFLDGLFIMLKDTAKDIRVAADACLGEFLEEIIKDPRTVDFGSMIKILLTHCFSNDEFTKLRAIEWSNEFIHIGKEKLLPFCAPLLSAVLPCLSREEENIKNIATKTNAALLELITTTKVPVSTSDILNTIILQFLNQNVPTRLAALNWIALLQAKFTEQLKQFADELFPALLKTLSDESEEVVLKDLEVMANIASLNDANFNRLMDNLVDLFSTDRYLLESRASLIIRQLSLLMNAERIYLSIARILETEEDLEFATVMVQTLNLILLTAKELLGLRSSLKNLVQSKGAAKHIFIALYRSWSHNPASIFSLCLLSQLYEHCYALVMKFGELEVSINFLVEMDKLVQLLESPVFLCIPRIITTCCMSSYYHYFP